MSASWPVRLGPRRTIAARATQHLADGLAASIDAHSIYVRYNRAEGEPMATKSDIEDIEKNIIKGQLRKLNALRKPYWRAI